MLRFSLLRFNNYDCNYRKYITEAVISVFSIKYYHNVITTTKHIDVQPHHTWLYNKTLLQNRL